MRIKLRRMTCLLLALVMVFTLVPTAALAAELDEDLVSSLAAVYDGDEARAREELEALRDAGLLNADGSLVELDIREDGERVALDDTAQRIADGREVGALTVNGNAVTPEKLTQLRQVDTMLEVLRLIDEDVEITDEHVANLESLISGIADGSIDLSGVISRGEAQVSAKRGLRMLGAVNTNAVPTPNTGTGTVENVTDGKYPAPYISESSYNGSYEFELLDPENKTWYTTSVVADAEVTLSCGTTATANSTFTVTATLNKAQPVPVSFDWSAAVPDVVALTGDSSGTVTWSANDTQLQKTFSVTLGAKNRNWIGSQCFVINAGNLHNATFAGGKTVWSQAVQITANDIADVAIEYPYELKEITNFTRITRDVNNSTHTLYYGRASNIFPSSGKFVAQLSTGASGARVYLDYSDFS